MQVKFALKPLFALWCSIACLVGCAASNKMPDKAHVSLHDATGAALSFKIKAIQAQQLNGKLNLAITSTEGSMLQLNGLDAASLKAGKQKAGSYQVVFMPGGMQAACVGSPEMASKLYLIEGENAQWSLRLEAELSCQGKKMKTKAQLSFTLPAPEFAAPNRTP